MRAAVTSVGRSFVAGLAEPVEALSFFQTRWLRKKGGLRQARANRCWGFAFLSLAGCSAIGPAPPSNRIVSTNPCLDAILVQLVAPDRVAAISHYSQDPRSSSMPIPLARRFRATGGTAEEVIALRPGLVLASSFTPAATLSAYRRLGLKVATYGTAATIDENRTQIRAIARALGAEARGEALVARIDRAVAEAAPPDANRPAALLWLGGSNLVNGQGTLIGEMLERAGFRNASADYGVRYTGTLPLEFVVARPPQVVMTPKEMDGASEDARRVSLRLRALAPSTRIASFPPELFFCGGPSIIPAMQRLAAIRKDLP